jgi:hypothetical protein
MDFLKSQKRRSVWMWKLFWQTRFVGIYMFIELAYSEW